MEEDKEVEDDGYVDLGDEEQILVGLENHIEDAWEQLGTGASYAGGESHFDDDRLTQITELMQGWSSDITEWLQEGKYESGFGPGDEAEYEKAFGKPFPVKN